MNRLRATLLVAAACVGAACAADAPIAANVVLDTTATRVAFRQPMTPTLGAVRVCFEFDRPGDSRAAPDLKVRLLMAGGAVELKGATVDRIGEARVCLQDSLAVVRSYTGLEVVAPRRIEVRRIDWGGSPAP